MEGTTRPSHEWTEDHTEPETPASPGVSARAGRPAQSGGPCPLCEYEACTRRGRTSSSAMAYPSTAARNAGSPGCTLSRRGRRSSHSTRTAPVTIPLQTTPISPIPSGVRRQRLRRADRAAEAVRAGLRPGIAERRELEDPQVHRPARGRHVVQSRSPGVRGPAEHAVPAAAARPVHDVQGLPARLPARPDLRVRSLRLRLRAGHQAGAEGLYAAGDPGELPEPLVQGRQEGVGAERSADVDLGTDQVPLLPALSDERWTGRAVSRHADADLALSRVYRGRGEPRLAQEALAKPTPG